MDKLTFGKYVREYRKKAGLTQAELAELLSVNVNTIGYIERGINYPDTSNLFPLISILNMSIDSLMFKETTVWDSKLPPDINKKISDLSPEDRSIVFNTLETLLDELLKKHN